MSSLNKVMLIGNVGKEPDIRNTQAGKAIANLSLATVESWKDQSGQKQERTEWHKVVVFGNLAGVVENYVSKGSKLYVEGKLATRKWTDNNGVEKYTTEITVDIGGKLVMLDRKRDQSEPSQKRQQPAKQQYTEEIPF